MVDKSAKRGKQGLLGAKRITSDQFEASEREAKAEEDLAKRPTGEQSAIIIPFPSIEEGCDVFVLDNDELRASNRKSLRFGQVCRVIRSGGSKGDRIMARSS